MGIISPSPTIRPDKRKSADPPFLGAQRRHTTAKPGKPMVRVPVSAPKEAHELGRAPKGYLK